MALVLHSIFQLTVVMSSFDFRKDVRLPQQLQRAMAAEAEATRDARAKVGLVTSNCCHITHIITCSCLVIPTSLLYLKHCLCFISG